MIWLHRYLRRPQTSSLLPSREAGIPVYGCCRPNVKNYYSPASASREHRILSGF